MPYGSFDTEWARDKQEIAIALKDSYEHAWGQGVKGLFDNVARSNMGALRKLWDEFLTHVGALTRKSSDPFPVSFKDSMRRQLQRMLSNKQSLVEPFVEKGFEAFGTVVAAGVTALGVPYVGAVLQYGIGTAGQSARSEVARQALAKADAQLAAAGGAEPRDITTTCADAAKLVQTATKQYVELCTYVGTLSWNRLEDAYTFPQEVFKLQQLTSALNVSIVFVNDHLGEMAERLRYSQDSTRRYVEQVREDPGKLVQQIVDAAYEEGRRSGEAESGPEWRYEEPVFRTDDRSLPELFGARVAHAMALGHWAAANDITFVEPFTYEED